MKRALSGPQPPPQLTCMFWIHSSWIAVNGVFTELPILFITAPESYGIAADLALALQIANIVPFAYFLLNLIINPTKRVKYHMDTIVIFIILVLGIVALAVMAGVWDKTFVIGGAGSTAKSWPLLAMVFLLGVVDCTSTLTYWPFVSNFGSLYFIALSVGESSTSLLSGIIGLIQQPGSASNFSFAVFCIILIVLTIISMIAFALLRFLPVAKREMLPWYTTTAADEEASSATAAADAVATVPIAAEQSDIRQVDIESESSVSVSSTDLQEEAAVVSTPVVSESLAEQPVDSTAQPRISRLKRARRAFIKAIRSKQFAIIARLFVIMGTISFFENGLLVTVHPYSIKNYPQTETL
jgi:hypothetical protein